MESGASSSSPAGDFAPLGVVAGCSLVVSALRHVGWWLDWHARAAPSDGSRPLGDSGVSGFQAQAATEDRAS